MLALGDLFSEQRLNIHICVCTICPIRMSGIMTLIVQNVRFNGFVNQTFTSVVGLMGGQSMRCLTDVCVFRICTATYSTSQMPSDNPEGSNFCRNSCPCPAELKSVTYAKPQSWAKSSVSHSLNSVIEVTKWIHFKKQWFLHDAIFYHRMRAFTNISLWTYCIIQFVWCLAIVFGVWLNEFPRPKGVRLPLLFYDRWIRKAGPWIPFVVFALRAILELLSSRDPPLKDEDNRSKLKSCFVLYALITFLRWLIYSLHLTAEYVLGILQYPVDHMLSDHIVLGASMMAILQSETILLLSYCLRAFQSKKIRSVQSCVILMFCVAFLMALTIGDMFYSALYFHPRLQSVIAFGIGCGFQFLTHQWLKTHLTN